MNGRSAIAKAIADTIKELTPRTTISENGPGAPDEVPWEYCQVSASRPVLARPLKMTRTPPEGSNPPAAANRGGGERAGVMLSQVSFVALNAHRSLKIALSPNPPVRKTSSKIGSNEKIG